LVVVVGATFWYSAPARQVLVRWQVLSDARWSHTRRGAHWRFEAEDGAAVWYSEAVQVVRVWQTLSELTEGETVWYSSLSHVVTTLHMRSDVMVGSSEAYSVAAHTVNSWQVLSADAVAAMDS
jgi:hypothetical protein